ncbi:MAG: UvrD-helicase domain-containing protein [Oscillospiraceae bacterium]|nr:UvrD-helicase domain-containing protein [Oscillospiraceae bacterium]MDD4367738.1 UvrD-helicase domain-containing protein [Oscillospiraceae bacterium]
MKFTAEQQRVIAAPREDILVQAAAGSGKTSVMVQRLVQRMAQGVLTADHMLVLTFTDAASSSMKRKIEQQLQEAAAAAPAGPGREQLQRQQLLLPYAAISTIHAFCLSLVRQQAYLLPQTGDLLPRFDAKTRTADAMESADLLEEAAAEVLDQAYRRLEAAEANAARSDITAPEAEVNDHLYAFIEQYQRGNDDRSLSDIICQTYEFLRTLPDYRDWLQNAIQSYEQACADFDHSQASDWLKRQLALNLDELASQAEELQAVLADPDTRLKTPKNKKDLQTEADNQLMLAQIQHCLTALLQLRLRLQSEPLPDWDQIHQAGLALSLPRVDARGKNQGKLFLSAAVNGILGRLLRQLNGRFPGDASSNSKLEDALPIFHLDCQKIQADLKLGLPALLGLGYLLQQTDKAYNRLKTRARVIDFADFEHLALWLLRQPEVRQTCLAQYQEIYIDEFQDTSSIQNAILSLLDQGNLFAVGDIKQSIYWFRHAKPAIFLERAAWLKTHPEAGSLLRLQHNFRSEPPILSAVNQLFAALMTQTSCGFDYSDGHELCTLKTSDLPLPVQCLLIKPDLGDVRGAAERRAQAAACLEGPIRALLSQGVDPSDIAILCRNNDLVETTSGVLAQMGLPAQLPSDKGFMETLELRVLESLLYLLDNQAQDIPLLSVLTQLPVYGGYSPAELLKIRLHWLQQPPQPSRQSSFHAAVGYYRLTGTDALLRQRLTATFTWLDELRQQASYLSVSDLIDRIYKDCSLPEYAASLPRAGARLKNLSLFQEWAWQYQQRQPRGLTYFARYVQQQRLKARTPQLFEESKPEPGQIRVMTFHRSKGLEFPYVFLLGLERSLNLRTGSFYLLDEDLGIGPTIQYPETLLSFPSLPQQVIRQKHESEAYAEEMRLLYVAMTRAQKGLFLLTQTDQAALLPERILQGLRHLPGPAVKPGDIPDWMRLNLTSYADMLFLPLLSADPDLAGQLARLGDRQSLSYGSWRFVSVQSQLSAAAYPPLFPNPTAGDQLSSQSAQTAAESGQPSREALSAEPAANQPALLPQTLLDSPDPAKVKLIAASFAYQYPHQDATRTAVKYSVSELKRQADVAAANLSTADPQLKGQEGELYPPLAGMTFEVEPWPESSALPPPAGAGATSNAAAEQRLRGDPRAQGILLHKVWRYIPAALIQTAQSGSPESRPNLLSQAIRSYLDRLSQLQLIDAVSRQWLAGQEHALAAYLRSELAARLAAVQTAAQTAAPAVYREMPFTLAVCASELFPERVYHENENVLVQGIIDLWFAEGDNAVLVDYKTDRLPDSRAQAEAYLSQRYSRQLALYSRAIEGGSGKTVKEKLIWSISRGEAFRLP